MPPISSSWPFTTAERRRESQRYKERERDCRIRANTLIINEKHAKNEKRYRRSSWDAKDLLAIKKGIFYRKEKAIPGSGRGKKQLGGERTDEEKRRGEGRQGEGENIMVSKQLWLTLLWECLIHSKSHQSPLHGIHVTAFTCTLMLAWSICAVLPEMQHTLSHNWKASLVDMWSIVLSRQSH